MLPREIERKYLLKTLPAQMMQLKNPQVLDLKYIDQFWLPGSNIIERFRHQYSLKYLYKPPEYFRVIKLGSGIERIEIEEPVDRDMFDALSVLRYRWNWPSIEKRRWVISDGPLKWEIDVNEEWLGSLAEVELPSVMTPPIPDWLAPHIVREVTDEKEYVNFVIAEHGFPVSK
jgi:CYTH domain-containing protein